MKSIRRRRNAYALLLALSLLSALWLGMVPALPPALAAGALSLASLLLLLRQGRRLHDARLIWDNRILAVPSALVSIPERQAGGGAEETVVSTFGILIGSEIYRWGLDGVDGARLRAARIDRQEMQLSFGDAAQTMRLALPHGIRDAARLKEITRKIWHETGVQAELAGWEETE